MHEHVYPHTPLSNTDLAWFFENRVPADGNGKSPNVAPHSLYGFSRKGKFESKYGANLRMVSTFGDETSFWGLDTGQSGNFLSRHYFDQNARFSDGLFPMFEEAGNETTTADL